MQGVVAAGSQLAAEAGSTVLRQGGNAVDAAVAAAFASFVAEIAVVNLGGGGYALLSLAAEADQPAKLRAVDFFSSMPKQPPPANPDFRKIKVDFGTTVQDFFIGRASSAVPGAIAGLCHLATNYGKLPLAKTVAPAVSLAYRGFAIPATMAQLLQLLQSIYLSTPASRALFAPKGQLLRQGERLALPQLATSLAKIGQFGAVPYYQGALAEAIVADQEQHGGLIAAADLAGYQVHETAPLCQEYRGYKVYLCPPSSIGGILIAVTLHVLETVSFKQNRFHSAEHLHILACAMAVANQVRQRWPKLAQTVQADGQLPEYICREARQQFSAGLAALPQQPKAQAAPKGMGNTTHISAMDAAGNAVSLTTSAGATAGYVVAETGLTSNNILGEIDLNPDGFFKAPPGCRLQSMMAPVIVEKDHRPVLALGSAGSTRLRSAILQTIVNVVDYRMSPDQAINAPRIHFEDGVLQVEEGIPATTCNQLQTMGYQLNLWQERSLFFGGTQAAAFIGGHLKGGGDSRREGAVSHS